MHRNFEHGGSHGSSTTRGLICITVKSVLESGALRQLSVASYGPRKTDVSVTFRG